MPDDAALAYYEQRFNEYNIKHEGIQTLFGKRYYLLKKQMDKVIN